MSVRYFRVQNTYLLQIRVARGSSCWHQEVLLFLYGSTLIMNVDVAVDHVTWTMTSPPGERNQLYSIQYPKGSSYRGQWTEGNQYHHHYHLHNYHLHMRLTLLARKSVRNLSSFSADTGRKSDTPSRSASGTASAAVRELSKS